MKENIEKQTNMKYEQPSGGEKAKSNFIDFSLFILLLIFFNLFQSIAFQTKFIIVMIYLFVLYPFFITTGATPGQYLCGIRVRKENNNEKKISFLSSCIRYLIVIFFDWTNYFGKKDKSNQDRYSHSVLVKMVSRLPEEELIRVVKRKRIISFIIVSVIYILWVLWIENYWLLLGIGIIFDLYITQKVHWAFWKKRGVEKQSTVIEWVDALIFAVVAATLIRMFIIEAFTIPTSSMEKSMLVGDYLFVSKASFGPKLPNTPLSFPFAHHTMPLFKSKSYLEWIKCPYKRLTGFAEIINNDVVVFNYPEGDTVVVGEENPSYYTHVRSAGLSLVEVNPSSPQYWEDVYRVGRNAILNMKKITVRPVDKRENYIKRCVAISGDTLQVMHNDLYINGAPAKLASDMQFTYIVATDGLRVNKKNLRKMNISEEDIAQEQSYSQETYNFIISNENLKKYNGKDLYIYPLTEKTKEMIRQYRNVKEVIRIDHAAGSNEACEIFPHHPDYKWSRDNFGPLVVPKKGITINLTIKNIPLYQRIIDLYEANDLLIKDSVIYINGKRATSYTFKMNYYWMMGDSRHKSQDSRYWGFVPEDHVVGKAVFIWLSLDKDLKFPKNIRWSRMFRNIR